MQPIKEKLLASEKLAPRATSPDSSTPAAIPLCPKCRAELHANTTACMACGTPWTGMPPPQEDLEFKHTLMQNAIVPGRASAMLLSVNNSGAAPELAAGIAQLYLPLGKPEATA